VAAASSDRNLLFGILALQMDFISRDALIKAMNAWAVEKAKGLGQILVEQQVLSSDRHALLEALVQEHLKQHGNDPQQSLAAVSSIGSVREELAQIADPGLQASLAHVSAAREPGEDSWATHASASVGTPTSSGLRFRILRPHARGGLGQVSVALDEELRREVALKEIQDRHADDQGSRSRFVLEAEITGGLEHPGIVPVYGLGQYADGRPYYAMRFIKGDSLKDVIERFHRDEGPTRDPGERTVEFRKVLGRFVDVCNAMAYAHSRGVLHRDLKPGNIMLGKYGETLVVDWGLAKPLAAAEGKASEEGLLVPASASGSARTQIGAALGTPAYMPPEQAAGRLDELGPASDVYSLGATLYHLLTGQPPFALSDSCEVLCKVQRGEFLRPRQVKTKVSAPLEAVCLKAMALRPDGTRLASGSMDKMIRIWEVTNAPGLFRLPQETSGTSRITFSPDGRRLASANSHDKLVKVWDTRTGRRLLALPAHPGLTRVAFSTDGQRLATAWDKTVRVWGSSSGQQFLILEGHAGTVWAIASAPDGKRLASGSQDGAVKVWDLATGEAVLCLDNHPAGVESVAFSSDGRRLAVATQDGTVKVWDAGSGELGATFRVPGRFGVEVAFSPDGKQLATAGADGPVKVWDAASGREQLSLQGHRGPPLSVVFSPDGRRLASGGFEGAVRVWDTVTGFEVLTLQPDITGVSGLAFSPDGRRLASASSVLGITIWEAEAPQSQPAGGHLEILKQRWLFWHLAEVDVSLQQKSWFAAAFHLSRLLEANPRSSLLLTKRGNAYAELGDWKRASDDFDQGRKATSGDPIVACLCSLCSLQQGDRDSHRRICREMLGSWGQIQNPDVLFHILRCAVVVPDVVPDAAELIQLADKAQESRIVRHHVIKLRGAALYRAGRFQEAAEALRRAIREEGKGGDRWEQLFLAMALHQLQQKPEAQQWLDQAIRGTEALQGNAMSVPKGDELDWTYRLDVAMLRLEAEALLKEKRP
jgi:WD40 repeat protein/tRNA A-37 threonylcarbamoyl transferase component Bud32